jgi:hypothetical protein
MRSSRQQRDKLPLAKAYVVSANESSKCFQGGLHSGNLENSDPDLVPELRLEHRNVGIIQVMAFDPSVA